jgi:hypothetical protein
MTPRVVSELPQKRASLSKPPATARQKAEAMKILELVLVMLAAAGLAVWRGVAMYKYTFKRKNL